MGGGGKGGIAYHPVLLLDDRCRRKLDYSIQYLDNQNICPIVGIGSPIPSSVSECVFPLGPKGGQHSLAGEGERDPIRTTGQKAWHSVYSVGAGIPGCRLYDMQFIFCIMANIRFYSTTSYIHSSFKTVDFSTSFGL